MSIKHLNANTVRLISSTVCISNVCSVVKEVVENSLDAGASSVFVRLEKHGLTRIEVRDNGTGISKSDVPLVGLANHTSRIINFQDLDHLASYGFRGQAFNALCAVADVSFTTRTVDDDFAITYTLDKERRIISSKPSHHCVGTSVVVESLFGSVPVRRKMLSTSSSSSLKTTLRLLRCFALAKPGLSITLSHDGSTIWRKPSVSSVFSAAQEVLGYKLALKMQRLFWKGSQVPMERVIDDDSMETIDMDEPECVEMEIEMVVPQKGCNILEMCSYPSSDGFVPNVYLLVNGRPIKHKKIDQMMNCWISRGTLGDLPKRKKPSWIMKIDLPSDMLDVNLEADKTKIILRCEDMILSRLEEMLSEYYFIFGQDPDTPVLLSSSLEPKKKRRKVTEESQDKIVCESQDNSCLVIPSGTDNNTIADMKPSSDSSPPLHAEQGSFEVEHDMARNGQNGTSLSSTLPNPSTNPSHILNVEDSFVEQLLSRNDVNTEDKIIEIKIPLLPVNDVEVEKNVGQEKECGAKGRDCLEGIDHNLSYFGSDEAYNWDEIVESTEVGKGNVVNDVVAEQQEDVEDVNSHLPNLEAWSRGKADFGKAVIAEPVKILQPVQTGSSSTNDITPASVELASGVQQVKVSENRNASRSSLPTSCNQLHNPAANGNLIVKSPLPNACSQLGRRDMRAFVEFSSKERPKILAEKPGIKPAEVAMTLAKQWRSLSKEDQGAYVSDTAQSIKLQNVMGRQSSLFPENHQNLWQQILSKTFVTVQSHPVVGMEMSVSIEAIENAILRRNSCVEAKKARRNKISLVGQLKPSGMWVFSQGSEIGIVRHFALQELNVYRKLMENLTIPLCSLPKPIELNTSVLGPEMWEKLISMEQQYDVFTDTTWITSKLIAKNDFRIKVSQDPAGITCATLTDIASVLSSYGIADLKEVLSKDGCVLSACRPFSVSNYIESEAIRMCRQSPPMMVKDELYALLKEWEGEAQLTCLHNQPVFVPLHSTHFSEEDT